MHAHIENATKKGKKGQNPKVTSPQGQNIITKKFKKPQFWPMFANFCPICDLVDPIYGVNFRLFCFICLD